MHSNVTAAVNALRHESADRDIKSLMATLRVSGGTRGGGGSGEEGGGGVAGPCAWAGFIVSGASTHLAKDRPNSDLSGEGYEQEAREPSPSPAKDAPLAGGEPPGGVMANIAPLGLGTDRVSAWLREMLLPEEVPFHSKVDGVVPRTRNVDL